MKSSFRFFLRSATAVFFSLALAVFAQQPAPPAAPAETPPAPADAAPAPAAPAAPATPAAAAEQPPAPAEKEGGLRRLDVPTEQYRRGNDFPFGDHVVPKGSRMHEAVSIMGSTTVEGEVRGDAVSVLGNTTVLPDAKVGGAAVAVLGRLKSEGEIRREAVSVLGGVNINGPVGGDLVGVLGDVTLGPKAVIQGDLVLVGGKLTRHADAMVHGNLVNVPFVEAIGSLEWLTTWIRRCLLLGRPLAFGQHLGWAWGVAFAFLAFYLVLALLFGRGIDKCVDTFEARPGSSILAAVLTVLLSPVAITLLVVTVLGILLVPFFSAGLLFAKLFGKAVMLAWIGRRVMKLAGRERNGHAVLAVLIGGLLVMLLYTIWGSFLLYKLLTWLGLGVVIYTLAQSMKREKPPAPAVAAAGEVAPEMPPVMPVPPVESVAVNVPAAQAPASTTSSGFVGADPGVPPAGAAGFVSDAVPPSPGATSEQIPPPPALPPLSTPPPPPTTTPPPPRMAAPSLPARPAVVISAATLPRAGFGIRLGAMVLDALLVGALLGFASNFIPRMLRYDLNPGHVLLVLAAYAAVMWKHKGTTIGGVICGLKVVRIDQRELDWMTSVVRAVSCFLSLFAAGLGFIWVAFDDEKQSWHDKIAGTTVVRVPKGVSLL